MKRFLSCFILLAVMALPCYAIGQEKEAMVHEAWFVHMESAGGWVAVDKGFYGKMKVKEVQGGPGVSPIQKVVAAARAGNIVFGNDYPGKRKRRDQSGCPECRFPKQCYENYQPEAD